jgi:hypothetical protein
MSEISAAIHQPNFLPWIGYFHKILKVDVFVFFDDVQYPRGKSFGNRVQIKSNDKELWINVPIRSKSEMLMFNEIEINNSIPWSKKLLKTINLIYKKSSYFDYLYPELEYILKKEYSFLVDFNIDLIQLCCSKIGINSRLIKSSAISECTNLNGEEKIIGLLKYLDSKVYVSGSGAGSKRYIDESHFKEAEIQLQWQSINSNEAYSQLGNTFIPKLSIIDLIFNEGPKSLHYLNRL